VSDRSRPFISPRLAPDGRRIALWVEDWSRDGRWLAYTEFHPVSNADVWITGADGRAGARPVVRTAASEKEPVFSPDGRWIAYVSDESGAFQVYAQPFPGPGNRIQVSTDGGTEPAWSRKGDELFYRNGRQMVAVSVSRSPDRPFGRPTVLFEGWYHDNIAPCRSYDVAEDGRFLMVTEPVGDDLPKELHVVLGWADDLKRRVPVP
jgi:hypothetical protein